MEFSLPTNFNVQGAVQIKGRVKSVESATSGFLLSLTISVIEMTIDGRIAILLCININNTDSINRCWQPCDIKS